MTREASRATWTRALWRDMEAHCDKEKLLPMWTVYNRPSDYPGHVVLRLNLVGQGQVQTTSPPILAETVNAALWKLEDVTGRHWLRVPRAASDDQVILGTLV